MLISAPHAFAVAAVPVAAHVPFGGVQAHPLAGYGDKADTQALLCCQTEDCPSAVQGRCEKDVDGVAEMDYAERQIFADA